MLSGVARAALVKRENCIQRIGWPFISASHVTTSNMTCDGGTADVLEERDLLVDNQFQIIFRF